MIEMNLTFFSIVIFGVEFDSGVKSTLEMVPGDRTVGDFIVQK